jgi:modulator of FtsH protease
MTDPTAIRATPTTALASNQVLRQTYTLLGMVMAVAAVGAGIGLALGMTWSIGMWIAFMVVFIGGPFLINRHRESQSSIALTLVWGGLVGFLLSGMIAHYLTIPNGGSVVFNALAATALIFFVLSAYAISSKKDFSFLTGFLLVGVLVVLAAIIANIFLQIALLSLVISSAAVLLMSAFILWDTSRMVHGGETNPVLITVSLFGSIVVLFSHLLNLMSLLSGDD